MVSTSAPPRRALVIGSERPFGAEIAARLTDDGFAVATAGENDDKLDLLVVNSPVRENATRFRDLSDRDFADALEAQLFEPAAAIRAADPCLTRDASIVLVASRAHLGGWGGANVIAAGGALIGLSRSLALEFAGRGVRVNVLAPDYAGQAWDTPAARAEVAAAVAWLAGLQSAAVSGETLLLDRGRTLRMVESARR